MNGFPGELAPEKSLHSKVDIAPLSFNYRRVLWVILIGLLAIRLLTLGTYPLQDTTEARYGEIARIMVETQNWVTPQFNYDVPFWGKPPLATWLSAGSFELLGVTEFSARLPSFVLALLVLVWVYLLARRQRDSDFALITIFILASGVLFFIIAGAVIMDAALLAGVTLSMVAFWQAMNNAKRYWGYAFFIGISIGLLSKGPIVLVLVGVPVVFWVILQGNVKQAWQKIPWISGGLLMLLLSVPWYVLAEQRTPGFIDYFIIGEHWNRFVVSGWQGDLYGTAHAKPRGTIWKYAVIAFLPWSFLLPILIWRYKSGIKRFKIKSHPWHIYLCLWALTPLLFFTFSGNILATYTLTAMVPLALLGAEFWLLLHAKSSVTYLAGKKYLILLPWLGIVTPVLLLSAIELQKQGTIKTKSQKDLVVAYQQLNINSQSRLIYLNKRPFSAQYYSQGQALEAQSWELALPYLQDEIKDFFVIEKNLLQRLPNDVLFKFRVMGEYHGYSLLQEVPENKITQN